MRREESAARNPAAGKLKTVRSLHLIVLTFLAAAPVTTAARGVISDEDRKWWAFQPVESGAPPQVQDTTWPKNDLDRFILARLGAVGLRPAPEADRTVLIRRLTFDLCGLPPTPAEVDAFVSDAAPDAHERLVDRLLASPHLGERQARHWLDLVRYADSDGYKADDFRPNAWRYRDYVIGSFNADKPFNQFVREQIAGDELFPDSPEALIATGYLRHWIYEYNNRDVAGQWSAILNDITDTTADVFLGLGLQCARCHDHKFDPLLQRDYFRLQAVFAPVLPVDGTVVASAEQREASARQQADWEAKTAAIREEVARIEQSYRQSAGQDAISKFPEETQAILRKPESERSPLETQLGALAWRQVLYEYDQVEGKIKGTDRQRLVELRKQLAAFDGQKPPALPVANTVRDVGYTAPEVRIPKKSEDIEPGPPLILDARPLAVRPGAQTTGRRSAFADWLVRPDNPLTARVIVNRVWAWHFGSGLARNASDFGTLGERPSHPELLDWLAAKFVAEGWSLKKLHRLIVTSATYRQSSASPLADKALLLDPENRLRWRWTTQRLAAEQIRDALLAASGELDLSFGGPAVDFTKPRRSIYNRVLRNTRDPLLDAFDAPQHFNSTASRDTTTTALQSLLLVNNRTLLDRAEALARRLQQECPGDLSRQITAAYRLAFGREPRGDESSAAAAFIEAQQRQMPADQSLATPLQVEPMPLREGQAAALAPASAQERLALHGAMPRPEGDFAVEAVVLLRSVHDNGDVRTIVSAWNGEKTSPGWAFGVTGKKSQRKPQMLVVQLVGQGTAGSLIYEPVFSGLTLQLDRSYYVGASVHPGAAGDGTVVFYLKDLANDELPLQTATVPHPVMGGVQDQREIVIGGRSGPKPLHLWDGLIDEVRLRRGTLSPDSCCYLAKANDTPIPPETLACWQFEPGSGLLLDAVSGKSNLQRATPVSRTSTTQVALADFCHALLNSSEFLYVE